MQGVFYCHGLPGSAAEIETLIPEGGDAPHVLAPLDFDGFDAAAVNAAEDGVHLIGFSCGAMTAIMIAATRPNLVSKLTLIAPAAPLELGNFLPDMAGKPVFEIAKRGRLHFQAFTAMQRLGVALAPKKVVDAMFHGSPDADMNLLEDLNFLETVRLGLKQSLGRDSRAYREAIHTYVNPWAHHLKDIRCPITLHHGTLDNWAPIEMSHAIQSQLKSHVDFISHEGLGHYSTLHTTLPRALRG